ncbi:MAG: phosphoribosylamine--glycine ligase, partial [Oceanicoccus sp.]
MKALVIGSGGREHALAWKMAKSAQVDEVFVAPGNAGTALEQGCTNVAIDTMDFTSLTAFVKEKNIELTIVG